jgi:hypothetical protein
VLEESMSPRSFLPKGLGNPLAEGSFGERRRGHERLLQSSEKEEDGEKAFRFYNEVTYGKINSWWDRNHIVIVKPRE